MIRYPWLALWGPISQPREKHYIKKIVLQILLPRFQNWRWKRQGVERWFWTRRRSLDSLPVNKARSRHKHYSGCECQGFHPGSNRSDTSKKDLFTNTKNITNKSHTKLSYFKIQCKRKEAATYPPCWLSLPPTPKNPRYEVVGPTSIFQLTPSIGKNKPSQ